MIISGGEIRDEQKEKKRASDKTHHKVANSGWNVSSRSCKFYRCSQIRGWGESPEPLKYNNSSWNI